MLRTPDTRRDNKYKQDLEPWYITYLRERDGTLDFRPLLDNSILQYWKALA